MRYELLGDKNYINLIYDNDNDNGSNNDNEIDSYSKSDSNNQNHNENYNNILFGQVSEKFDKVY